MTRALTLAGCVCLLIVVLTHVAERFHILPGMGWGLPNSPGHYLDLFSAIAGVGLLLAAYVLRRRSLQDEANSRNSRETGADREGRSGSIARPQPTGQHARNQEGDPGDQVVKPKGGAA